MKIVDNFGYCKHQQLMSQNNMTNKGIFKKVQLMLKEW
jgi:hypothetical protein